MKRTLFFVALTVISGLIGGMLGVWLLSGRVAEAQGAENVFVKSVVKPMFRTSCLTFPAFFRSRETA